MDRYRYEENAYIGTDHDTDTDPIIGGSLLNSWLIQKSKMHALMEFTTHKDDHK